jgi:hypothetical protein
LSAVNRPIERFGSCTLRLFWQLSNANFMGEWGCNRDRFGQNSEIRNIENRRLMAEAGREAL